MALLSMKLLHDHPLLNRCSLAQNINTVWSVKLAVIYLGNCDLVWKYSHFFLFGKKAFDFPILVFSWARKGLFLHM